MKASTTHIGQAACLQYHGHLYFHSFVILRHNDAFFFSSQVRNTVAYVFSVCQKRFVKELQEAGWISGMATFPQAIFE